MGHEGPGARVAVQERQSLALFSLVTNRPRPWLHSSSSVTGSALGLRVEGPPGETPSGLLCPLRPPCTLGAPRLGRSCKELARKLVLGSSQALPRHMVSQPTLCGGGWDPCRPGQGPQCWLLGPAGLRTGP